MGKNPQITQAKYTVGIHITGNVLAVRALRDRGRVQIPKQVRELLGVSDGDSMYWVESNGRVYLMKAATIT